MRIMPATVTLMQSALTVIYPFKDSALVARETFLIQEAVAVVDALSPIIHQFGFGKDIIEADVRKALAGRTEALSTFDRLIKDKGTGIEP